MKINVFNRDRKGGHVGSNVFDEAGSGGGGPVVRKYVKQITGRKARREHAKAIKRELELWAADCEEFDARHQWYVDFWDSINEDNLNGDDDREDEFDWMEEEYGSYDYGDYHYFNDLDWKKGFVTDQWGNLVARFESYFRASEYVAQNPHFTLHEC